MHLVRLTNLMRGGLLAIGLAAAFSSTAEARPKPGPRPSGFRLFSSAEYRLQANRVSCRITSNLNLCDSGSSTVPGGLWPKGSPDGYVFSSGLTVAGIIDPASPGNIWAGDTTGASFFVESGDNGSEVLPIFTSSDASDFSDANWPASAYVPLGDATANFYDPSLRGTKKASQEDVYFLTWDGNPGSTSSRIHPLGLLVETRVLGWNFPAGNEDIIYLLITFYNVTSGNAADYASVRPSLQSLLLSKGQEFRASMAARFGVNIPPGGYTVKETYAAYIADMDVANFDLNFAGVNVPFALGYAYERDFSKAEAIANSGWTFDPGIFGSDPFFEGPGFVGAKFLASPIDPLTSQEVGLTLFNTFSRSGNIQDPNDDHQLWRYMSGNFDPTADGLCSVPNVLAAKMCFVNITAAEDMRFLQSSGPFDLVPGQPQSIVVALLFAAPVKVATCPGVTCNVPPAPSAAALTILGDPARMATSINTIDSVTGFLGFTNGGVTDPDPTTVSQGEFVVVKKSLLDKALVAQNVFDSGFLLPNAPDAPPFFLIPGDNQVTVLWRPSAAERTGDRFFNIASQPLLADLTVNPLYDPNFRKFDVEGYRIYRGRTNSTSDLTLIAQFDYSTTVFKDFRAVVNPIPDCAPEFGRFRLRDGCPVIFDPLLPPGTRYQHHNIIDIVGTITQVKVGGRVLLANGLAQILPGELDSANAEFNRTVKLGPTASTLLTNTGVPFVFVDQTARNSLKYFYSVTAFDINSVTSGPSSLESNRITHAVIPVPLATNSVATSSVTPHVLGRGVILDGITALPTLDATGKFSGPFPPSGAASLQFIGQFVSSIFAVPGQTSATLTGITLGDARLGIPVVYHWLAQSSTDATDVSISITQSLSGDLAPPGEASGNSVPFPAATADAKLGKKFGLPPGFKVSGFISQSIPSYQPSIGWGRGCADGAIDVASGECPYGGPRWFSGANETVNNPGANNNEGAAPMANVNNAGALAGIATINTPHSFMSTNNDWRLLEAILGGAARAADFKVYWGNPGKVDSVIDITHNVPVLLDQTAGGTYGILNTAAGAAGGSRDARPAVLTFADFGCVQPFKTMGQAQGLLPCTAVAPYVLSDSARAGVVAFFSGPPAGLSTVAAAANPGFGMYIAGNLFLFELAPAAPLPTSTVWTLRSYVGTVLGGDGAAGDLGAYSFKPVKLPFTAVGAQVVIDFSASNAVAPATSASVANVHTVPDPYYVKSKFEATTFQKVLKFVNLPQDAIIRIYSTSGVLVRVLEHHATVVNADSASQGSQMDWDLRNRNNQVVASGVYFFHVEAGGARKVGRFTVVNFAE